MAYQILNNLGEVVVESTDDISSYGSFTEDGTWVTNSTDGYNYFLFDSQDDLVSRWSADSDKEDVIKYRIIKYN